MEQGLIYEPKEETIDTIEWDYLENAWIDNLGNIYKTAKDIPIENWIYALPGHLRQYARPIKTPKVSIKKKQKRLNRKHHFVKGV